MKKQSEAPIPYIPDEPKGFIQLPVTNEGFTEFICSLLGQPQSIEKIISGEYCVGKREFSNLHSLLTQRIEEQNAGKLVSFLGKIFLSDETILCFNSFEEFNSCNDTGDRHTIRVELKWSFLIEFPGKNHAEKQNIDITFSPRYFLNRNGEIILIRNRESVIEFEIEHTARSWGNDIEALLTNSLSKLIVKKGKIWTYFRNKSENISITVGATYFYLSLVGAYFVSKTYINNQIYAIKSTFLTFGSDVNKKVDFISEYIGSGGLTTYYIKLGAFLTISLMIAIFVGLFIEKLSQIKSPSFIVMSDYDLHRKDQVTKEYERGSAKKILSIVIALLINILSSYAYAKMTAIFN